MLVPSSNVTGNTTTVFLVGILGLEAAHIWITVPLCFIYMVTVVTNCTNMYVIWIKASLHEPMHLFLCMLALTDLVGSTSVLPKMLYLFWFGSREIDFNTCLTQMFFIHSLSIMESAVLVAMALDHYVAICKPLRCASILTNSVIVKIGCLAVISSVVLMAPLSILAARLPYCKTNIIPHTYCKHMGIVRLACANALIGNIYGLVVALLVMDLDLLFIAMSYAKILLSVLKCAMPPGMAKAFSTCGSHVCVIVLVYIPAFFSFLTHRFGHNAAPYIHILIGNFYILVPPFCNPIVYGVKTKAIQGKVLHLFQRKKGLS
ncbi:olfactory receptor 52K1 [Alligator mississippiensis]|nr:olfactory receptor 52K1 [Alligator mississippiensis]